MGLIVTPGRMLRLAECYHQLEQMLNAGFGLIQALQSQRRSVLPVTAWLPVLQEGGTFADALNQAKDSVPEFDAALLEAGEKSGKLPHCLGLLSDYYRERAQLLRQAFSQLAYPLFLFHFAVFIIPFPAFFSGGGLWHYLRSTVGVLLPFYAVGLGVAYACQGRHGEWWRAIVESVALRVPVLGTARKNLSLARLATALEALLAAGVPIIQAWPMAAAASGSPAVRRQVAAWKEPLESGTTPAEMVGSTAIFPDLFADQYRTGEISGRLEESLQRLRDYYREEGERKMQAFAQWVPRLVYLAVIIMIAFHVISFWTGYFRRIGEVMQ